jgi:hypothetical protein
MFFFFFIIIIGSTALCGVLTFPRSVFQLKHPAIASSDFVKKLFSRVGLSAPCQIPDYPGVPMFSVRVCLP